ncbi:adenosylmethionine--8-amino-7-oxononanoate aminotransferase BioA [Niastella vici]|uniref:Adenosylmethionine-8-amino-7-oxononanoate aminotransferase n=1 Tax=Niastella vici TaxID=1703345 RepID=A0A1V9FT38_9BACT|nr:adenosylmethionine--8-amino-7-oxononanoate transaminase [Niastella vici]OQP61488.1 adenosylmethionine--8-amino-7-oxononanoate aminotransferase BioA [Niastella vici]
MAASLTERDKQVVWHPYTPQKAMPEPIPVVKGEGVYIIDENGKTYIDAISSWWVTIHGHANAYIAEKIYEQAKTLEQVIFAGFTHEPAVRLAERLLEILPGEFSKIFYSDNGSTAVEVGVKMALQYWWNKGDKKRNKILALNRSYHGDTFGTMSLSDRSVFTLAFQDKLFEVIFIDPPVPGAPLYNGSWDELACIIYEPLLQGAGGMNMYDAGELNSLLQQCHAHDVICVADEVMTGFGRTGKLFASEYMEEKPDIICLSKGLTGGTMALGVTACTAKIHSAFVDEDRKKTFFHGHSFTANPLACTAALASLDLLLKRDCQLQIDSIAQQHKQFIQQLGADARFAKNVKNLRSIGTIMAFEIESGRDGYLNNIGLEFTRKALEQGVYLRPLGNTVYIMPPYCITKEQLQQVYAAIDQVLVAVI